MKKNKIRTIKKSLLCLIACFILSFLSLIVISATFPHAYAKDSLLATDNDYIAFVKENNIEIPEEFIDSPGLGDLIKDIIETIERTPDCKYVFLRRDAAQYIGHWFNKQTTDADGNMTWTRVQLASVDIQNEVTTAWSPVTYGHLCYYVKGMLSMPGATEGLINIFEVDPDTMKIDEEKYLADIAEYGLLSYEEVADIMSEDVFNAFNGKYLLVSIGKGLTTWEDIYSLLDRYSTLF